MKINSQTILQLRPQDLSFLKVLCILSFIACGLWILLFGIGSLCLTFSEEKIMSVWDQVIEKQPQLESANPVEVFHEIGKVCLISLLLNIASLIGVIMMWRLNKIGFFIYAVAELVIHFFGMNINGSANESKSYGFVIFFIVIDLVFIAMYAVNL